MILLKLSVHSFQTFINLKIIAKGEVAEQLLRFHMTTKSCLIYMYAEDSIKSVLCDGNVTRIMFNRNLSNIACYAMNSNYFVNINLWVVPRGTEPCNSLSRNNIYIYVDKIASVYVKK